MEKLSKKAINFIKTHNIHLVYSVIKTVSRFSEVFYSGIQMIQDEMS